MRRSRPTGTGYACQSILTWEATRVRQEVARLRALGAHRLIAAMGWDLVDAPDTTRETV